MTNNTRPFQGPQQPQQPPSPETIEALSKLATLFKDLKPDYIPITKSLEMIGIVPKIMEVMFGDDLTECLVIPVDVLMHKEWLRMTGRESQPQSEGKND